MTAESVFTGLKVLDVSSFIAAPAAATMLSDFGADVIKIEPPGQGDPQRRLSSVPPSPQAQVAVLREAYARAGIAPASVHYVEAHGTGTLLGDPIEMKALGTVLCGMRSRERPLTAMWSISVRTPATSILSTVWTSATVESFIQNSLTTIPHWTW